MRLCLILLPLGALLALTSTAHGHPTQGLELNQNTGPGGSAGRNKIPAGKPRVTAVGEDRSRRLWDEGRRHKGGLLRRIALPLLVLLTLKAGLGLPVLFGGVALAAFKGLWSGASALILAGSLALRNLIPPPKIILPPPPVHPATHTHVTDYISDYHRRKDDFKDDYTAAINGGWKSRSDSDVGTITLVSTEHDNHNVNDSEGCSKS